MEAQSQEGFFLLVTLVVVCIVILVTAFSLTFFRNADTSDNKGH